MDTKVLLNKLVDGNNLSEKESSTLLEKIIGRQLNSVQIAASLIALRTKGETEQEILGFIKTMRKHMIKINAPEAIDIVGTGGDGQNTFNISTLSSLVVAGCGVKMAKHGNRAASGKCGSADVLEELGVNINLSPSQAEKVFKKVGFVFLFAPNFHPAMKLIAPIRKELGVRTIFNFLGPFLNPAETSRQLIGVPNLKIADKLAKTAAKLNFDYLLIVTSKDGMDEITTTTDTNIFEIKNSHIRSYQISPRQFGIKLSSSKKDLQGGSPKENAKIIIDILKGNKGAKKEIVLLNSAAALYIAGKAKNISAGIKMAEESMDGGGGLKILQNLISETQKYA